MTAYFRSAPPVGMLEAGWYPTSELVHIDDLLDKMPDRGVDAVLKSAAFPISRHEADQLTMRKYGVSFAERRAQIRAEYNLSFRRDPNLPSRRVYTEQERAGRRIDHDEVEDFSVQRGVREG